MPAQPVWGSAPTLVLTCLWHSVEFVNYYASVYYTHYFVIFQYVDGELRGYLLTVAKTSGKLNY